jgi:uncharacterized protein (TIGR03083 family)
VNTPVTWPDHIASIRSDTERMAVAYEAGPVDAPVAACPGWDLRKLVEHMAYIHRWAGFAVANGRAPQDGDVEMPEAVADGADVSFAAWLRAGGNKLADELAASDPQDDTWHVFPAEKKMWVWARRQAQETAMHRWDAETATAGESSLDPLLAAEGVQEYLELGLPRVLSREGVSPPESALRLHCTDVPGDWVISSVDSTCSVHAGADEPSDAVLHGTAESLILVLMGRADRSSLQILGDAAVADEWLSLPGW